jgi:hypothetical protein
MVAFSATLILCELIDFGFYPHMITEGAIIKMYMLHRACVNQAWRDLYPRAMMRQLTSSKLDRYPIVIHCRVSMAIKQGTVDLVMRLCGK